MTENKKIQELLMRIGSSITLISCLLILLVYKFSNKLKNKSYNKIICYIAISDILTSIGGLLGISKSGSIKCYIQTLLTNIFPLSSIFWTTIISYILYSIIKSSKLNNKDITSYFWIHCFCWGLPLLVTLLPLTTETYGTFNGEDGWCFLEPGVNSPSWTYQFWIYISFFGWVYLSLFIYFILILYIFYYITYSSSSTSSRSTSTHSISTPSITSPINSIATTQLINKILSKLIWYPIIIFFSWCVITLYILWDAYDPSSSILQNQLFIYFTFTVPLFSGFLTSLAFFFGSSEAQKCLKDICYKVFFFKILKNDRHQPVLQSSTNFQSSNISIDHTLSPNSPLNNNQQSSQQQHHTQSQHQFRLERLTFHHDDIENNNPLRETELTSSTE